MILFYDGSCGLCHRWVRFILKHDQDSRFSFAQLQGSTAKKYIHASFRQSLISVALFHNQRLYIYSSAVVRILWWLGGRWKVLGWLIFLIPFPIRDFGYLVVSQMRYRIFGKLDQCSLPSPTHRKQFLD